MTETTDMKSAHQALSASGDHLALVKWIPIGGRLPINNREEMGGKCYLSREVLVTFADGEVGVCEYQAGCTVEYWGSWDKYCLEEIIAWAEFPKGYVPPSTKKMYWLFWDSNTQETDAVPCTIRELPKSLEQAAAIASISHATAAPCEDYAAPENANGPFGGLWKMWGYTPEKWMDDRGDYYMPPVTNGKVLGVLVARAAPDGCWNGEGYLTAGLVESDE